MAIILNIDTAVETASVCMAKGEDVLQFAINKNQKDHAAWLHPAVQKITADAGIELKDIDAIAVTIGPGSYTGLRVGLSAVKGFCFALDIPLICVNTLELMAHAGMHIEADMICPMIDARRMEVFMAVYTKNMQEIIKPCATIIDKHSFDPMLAANTIAFLGNGSKKLQGLVVHPNAIFNNMVADASNMIPLSHRLFAEKKFANLAYVEPLYIKEFYSAAQNK